MTTQAQSTVSSAYAHSDELGMDVYCLIGDGPTVCIFHTAPFNKTLSWIEYDIASSRLDFVMEDGDIKNFGVAIDRKFAAYIKNTYTVPVVLRQNGAAVEGFDYPLIQHAA
ncbi:MAG: hypothetical protein KGQ41_01855 [Alphaproteobacteria bacterium]|nr:hypothetical protein [Alphaproteobacteria bacterium]